MKTTHQKTFKSIAGGSLLSALLFCAAPLQAENVFITGWIGTSSSFDRTPAPLSTVSGFANLGAGNASASQVSPVPVIPNNARRIHYGNSPGAYWDLTPTNLQVTPTAPAGTGPYTFTQLQNIGVYKIYLTKGQDNNGSTNIIVELTATDNGQPAQLADTNGVAASAIQLDMYQKGKPNHVWVHVGYITNTTPNPTIRIAHVSGEINDFDAGNNNAQRWYTDAIRFEFLDACVGVANQVGVSGPLVQGQTFVNVTGVADGATNVTVYANNVLVGQTNSPSPAGFSAGNLTVVTTTLNKGNKITAGQIKNGCSSIVPTTGPEVGAGPNGSLRAFLSCWQNVDFAGPIGANGTNASTVNYFLKATGFTSGFGTAPTGGELLAPSTCWQTVTFDHSVDPSLTSNGTSTSPNTDPFCALDGLLFSIVDDESGPYDIYVDQIKNGDVIIENFEGIAPGSSRLFAAPNQASAPNPASVYIGAPNSSLISQNNAFDGTNACRVQWQWTDGSNLRWARVPANMTNSSKFYPQLDTTKPITIRYLLLPAGESTGKLSFPSVPANQTKAPNQSVTFSATPAGQGPFTYQWKFAGSDISGETTSSYTKNNLQLSDEGTYSVFVTGGTGCNATLNAKLTVAEIVNPPTLNYSVNGGQVTFTWTGSFTLQSKGTVDGTWNDVTSTSGYQENLNSSTTKFFRLRQ